MFFCCGRQDRGKRRWIPLIIVCPVAQQRAVVGQHNHLQTWRHLPGTAQRSPCPCLKLPETKTQSSLGKKTCSCRGKKTLLCSWKMWNFTLRIESLYLFSKALLCPPTLSYRTWKTHCSLQATPNILKIKKMEKSLQQAENQHLPSFSIDIVLELNPAEKGVWPQLSMAKPPDSFLT